MALNVSIALDHCKNMHANDLMSLLPCLTPYYLLLAHTERSVIYSRLFFKEGFSWERPTTASLLYLPLYSGYIWSVFRGQRSLNSEARQTCQIAVSLLSWQFPVLHNHWLSIEHYQKIGLFGVLIHGYDLTQTLSNLVSQSSFSLLNLQGTTHSHWWFMSSICLDRLKNGCLSVPGFSMFRLADGKT